MSDETKPGDRTFFTFEKPEPTQTVGWGPFVARFNGNRITRWYTEDESWEYWERDPEP